MRGNSEMVGQDSVAVTPEQASAMREDPDEQNVKQEENEGSEEEKKEVQP